MYSPCAPPGRSIELFLAAINRSLLRSYRLCRCLVCCTPAACYKQVAPTELSAFADVSFAINRSHPRSYVVCRRPPAINRSLLQSYRGLPEVACYRQVAPTELRGLPEATCYKQVTPTELQTR